MSTDRKLQARLVPAEMTPRRKTRHEGRTGSTWDWVVWRPSSTSPSLSTCERIMSATARLAIAIAVEEVEEDEKDPPASCRRSEGVKRPELMA